MKKRIAILLALVLTMGLSVSAFAEEKKPVDQGTVEITKKYTMTGGEAPTEEFNFSIEKVGYTDKVETLDKDAMPLPEVSSVTLGGKVAEDTFTITLPAVTAFPKLGVYTYKITEIPGKTAGTTYCDSVLFLNVTVLLDEEGTKIRVPAVHLGSVEGDKIEEIENKYDAGKLSIKKTVSGNLGDKDKYFTFKVTLTGVEGLEYAKTFNVTGTHKEGDPTTAKIGENTFYLKNSDVITIENLPYGVTYAIEETNCEGYTIKINGEVSKEGKTDGSIDKENTAPEITYDNCKDTTIDTGIRLDSLPFIAILAIAAVSIVLVLRKRRFS